MTATCGDGDGDGDDGAATTTTTTNTTLLNASKQGQVPWRRILWARQPYADNHVSDEFLKKLQSSPSGSLPTFNELVIYSLPLSQQLSTTLVFVGSFLHLRQGQVSAETLASGSAFCILFCASTTSSTLRSPSKQAVVSSSKPLAQPLSYALLGLVILALSPLLRTLTEATTSDSITALSAALFLLSFTLADYTSSSEKAKRQDEQHQAAQLPATLSLNASLCSSIVLASRLDSPIQVFSLMLTSIFLFAFLPRWVRHNLPNRPSRSILSIVYTIAITLLSGLLLVSFSTTAAILNISTAVFLSLACPAWMRKAQDWKVGRRGPWDVGIPRIRSR